MDGSSDIPSRPQSEYKVANRLNRRRITWQLEVAKQLIEKITMNNYQWNLRGKSVGKPTGMIEVNEVIVLATQLEALS